MADRVLRLKVSLQTGDEGMGEPPVIVFNGHAMPLEPLKGSCKPRAEFVGTLTPASVAHEVHLRGPSQGRWTLQQIEVRYEVAGRPAYDIKLGGVELDGTSSVDIWRAPPPEVFEV